MQLVLKHQSQPIPKLAFDKSAGVSLTFGWFVLVDMPNKGYSCVIAKKRLKML